MGAENRIRVRMLTSLAENQAMAEMRARGADASLIGRLAERLDWIEIIFSGLVIGEATALREKAKIAGAQALLCKPLLPHRGKGAEPSDLIVAASAENLKRLAQSLEAEPREVLVNLLENLGRPRRRELRLKEKSLILGEKTLVMGILNATPDSFSKDSFGLEMEAGLERGKQMLSEGADIIDIGGESTRPGAESVEAAEEMRRVLPLVEALAAETGCVISIDTMKSEVAKEALARGAQIVNDISALTADPKMAAVAAQAQAGVILMHMQGNPRDMQKDPKYSDLMGEITAFLEEAAAHAKAAGIGEDQIMIDPGIGFGKTVEHNLEILRRLGELRSLGYPVLVGTSRKSTIGKITGGEAQERLEGTAATVALAIAAGAEIVRVHDVKEMAKVAKMSDAILRVKPPEPREEERARWSEEKD